MVVRTVPLLQVFRWYVSGVQSGILTHDTLDVPQRCALIFDYCRHAAVLISPYLFTVPRRHFISVPVPKNVIGAVPSCERLSIFFAHLSPDQRFLDLPSGPFHSILVRALLVGLLFPDVELPEISDG
jgi:hypothetical protein